MKFSRKLQSIVCICIIFAMFCALWKGPDITELVPKDVVHKQQSVTVAQASTASTTEMRAIWISYLDFQGAGVSKMSEAKFKNYIDKLFNKCVSLKMNTVIVQVRPFSDAMYESDYFPWSSIVSGKQGKKPGYDPLRYMVKAAHARDLEIHAWVNPYRVTLSGMKMKSLSKDNKAVRWRKSKSTKRNVLSFGGQLYYNPAKPAVRKLIVNGVTEIVKNYDVDGIHFDDYFYPTLGSKYQSKFDAKEYKAYKKKCKSDKKSPMSIVSWRRENVNKLLRDVYKAIKAEDEKVSFGVSPAGNINNLYGKDRYYCDVKKWMSKSGYVDYIAPQIYWSFTNKVCPYKNTVKKWAKLKKNKNVRLYIGLAAYRAGISKKEAKAIGDIGWSASKSELKKQVVAGRKVKGVTGFVFFRYQNMTSKKVKKEIKNLKKVLK